MTFYDYLLNDFKCNEPILIGEIQFGGYSKPWINKELADLCGSGKIVRFEKGVYYVPVSTALGPSRLNPFKVIEKKYIKNENECNGYYSGATFLNQTGLSTQVPNVVEIYTNSETSKVREINVGQMRVILRKARTHIDNSNVGVQSFLELMNSVSSSFFDDDRRRIALDYINKYGISRKQITKYAGFFPDKAMRTLVESEIIYDVAQ